MLANRIRRLLSQVRYSSLLRRARRNRPGILGWLRNLYRETALGFGRWFGRRQPGRPRAAWVAPYHRFARRRRHLLAIEGLEQRQLLTAYMVNALSDSNSGSGTTGDLRFCMTKAAATAGTHTISFSPGLTGTIKLKSALPDMLSGTTLTLTGPGASNLTGPSA